MFHERQSGLGHTNAAAENKEKSYLKKKRKKKKVLFKALGRAMAKRNQKQ